MKQRRRGSGMHGTKGNEGAIEGSIKSYQARVINTESLCVAPLNSGHAGALTAGAPAQLVKALILLSNSAAYSLQQSVAKDIASRKPMRYDTVSMVQAESFFLAKLETDFAQRKRKNPSYSLRAYANYLGLNSATLSSVFKKKRSLPLKSAEKIAARLSLNPIEKEAFISSVYVRRMSLSQLNGYVSHLETQYILREQEHFEIISQWEHHAILSVLETEPGQFNSCQLGQRLGISEIVVIKALKRLHKAGFIETLEKENDEVFYVLGVGGTNTTRDVPSEAVRLAHRESMRLASEKLDTVSIHDRYFGIATMTVDPNQLSEIKNLIREFKSKLIQFAEKGKKREVYRLNFQFFPLTEKNKKESENTHENT